MYRIDFDMFDSFKKNYFVFKINSI